MFFLVFSTYQFILCTTFLCNSIQINTNGLTFVHVPIHYIVILDHNNPIYSIRLTLNLINFLNRLVNLPFLELSIINFGDIKLLILRWSANSIEPGQTVQCRLTWWLYNDDKGLSLSVPAR